MGVVGSFIGGLLAAKIADVLIKKKLVRASQRESVIVAIAKMVL